MYNMNYIYIVLNVYINNSFFFPFYTYKNTLLYYLKIKKLLFLFYYYYYYCCCLFTIYYTYCFVFKVKKKRS